MPEDEDEEDEYEEDEFKPDPDAQKRIIEKEDRKTKKGKSTE